MMETVEKYCEDIFCEHKPIARRNVQLYFGMPIDIRQKLEANDQSVKKCLEPLTVDLENQIKALILNADKSF